MFTPVSRGNGNDNISPEEHFKNSKISIGSPLYLEVFIFDYIFKIHLVIQSL
jgi:hypothetical protein